MVSKTTRPSTPTPPPEPTKRTGLWIAVGVGVVIAIVGLAAILTSRDDSELSVGTATCDVASSSSPLEPAETWPVTVTGAALPALPDSGTDPAIGTAAPTLCGRFFDGTPVNVDPAKGPAMLVFLAHWCPHCNREAPELMKWKASGNVPDGLQVIGVTTAVATNREHYPPSTWILDEMKWTWPVLADSPNSDAFTAMGGSGFPYVVIVGSDGKVLDRWSGELGGAAIEARVAAALA